MTERTAKGTDETLARTKALYAAREWRECLASIDEALAGGARGRAGASLRVMRGRVLGLHLGKLEDALASVRVALREHPGDRPLALLEARLERQAGRLVSAFGLYKRIFRTGDPTAEAAEALFSILVRRHRFGSTTKALMKSLMAGSSVSPSLRHDMAVLALRERDGHWIDQLAETGLGETVSPGRSERLSRIARVLRSELDAGDTMKDIRHVAIAGVSFVGSTIFGVILGSMPGFAFAGETHWLTHTRVPKGSGKASIQEVADRRQWPSNCRVCGRKCERFTDDFRMELAEHELGWYAQIANRLGVSNLVSSDKNVYNFWERDPLFRFDVAILFKSPAQQIRSVLKQEMRQNGPDAIQALRAEIPNILERWADTYLGHLKLLNPTGRRAVINWEQFVEDPARHLDRLGCLLDIPLSAQTLQQIRLGHFIGGNTGVDPSEIARTGTIALRPSNAPPLPDELGDIVASSRSAQFVFRLLQNEYEREFRLC